MKKEVGFPSSLKNWGVKQNVAVCNNAYKPCYKTLLKFRGIQPLKSHFVAPLFLLGIKD